MKLHELKPEKGSRRNKKRVGRGPGSGTGLRCGYGNKGQNSRSGGGVRIGFEGGQMPLTRRLPKRGFKNALFKKKYAIVNVSFLDAKFEAGAQVDIEVLQKKNFVKKGLLVKVLAEGEITKPLQIRVNAFSENARKKIEASGGKIEIK